ncbi:unnamed protein product [Spirodela intermedia]|uniref:Uncharacterized protein n=1 Tax=Spirodela intermedia TaxID=51605 RepID=A0A7I8JCR5_SPIIN|nr:unnamed protein product [Spirodela intermedia]CAA6667515.1 unnamed protein product [Spirodela intermedia]
MCDLKGAHASGTTGRGVIGKLSMWYDQILSGQALSSILLYLLGECAHSTLSNDVPYIVLEGRLVELVQQVDSSVEDVCHHVLLALLVMKDKGEVLQEVMAPVFESLNDGIELTIVSGVSKPYVIQLLAEVLYGMACLAKDTPNTDARGIISGFKYLAKVEGTCAPLPFHITGGQLVVGKEWSYTREKGLCLEI